MAIDISVIVTNYNGRKFLRECFTSVLKEKYKNFEIIFIDDHSNDKSFEYVKARFGKNKRFHLFQTPKNLVTSKVFNIALNMAKGKYLFYINNDTKLKPGWSKEIHKTFATHKKAAVIQGKIYRMGTTNYDYAGDFIGPLGFLIERAQGAKDIGQFDRIDKIFSIKGTCMIVKKEALRKIEGFDEDYKFGLDETDMTWRCWLLGYETLFNPNITIWHYFGTKKKSKKYYYDAKIHYEGCKNTIATLFKNLGTRKLFTMLPLNVLCWSALALVFLIKLDFYHGFSLLKGIGWNILHVKKQIAKRRHVQKTRKLSDVKLFALVGAKRDTSYYLNKGLSYIMGRSF